jgi:hypothetical protein
VSHHSDSPVPSVSSPSTSYHLSCPPPPSSCDQQCILASPGCTRRCPPPCNLHPKFFNVTPPTARVGSPSPQRPSMSVEEMRPQQIQSSKSAHHPPPPLMSSSSSWTGSHTHMSCSTTPNFSFAKMPIVTSCQEMQFQLFLVLSVCACIYYGVFLLLYSTPLDMASPQ